MDQTETARTNSKQDLSIRDQNGVLSTTLVVYFFFKIKT